MPALTLDSLARRFALVAVALALSVLLLTILASWWLVSQQQQQATRILLQKEAEVAGHFQRVQGKNLSKIYPARLVRYPFERGNGPGLGD